MKPYMKLFLGMCEMNEKLLRLQVGIDFLSFCMNFVMSVGIAPHKRKQYFSNFQDKYKIIFLCVLDDVEGCLRKMGKNEDCDTSYLLLRESAHSILTHSIIIL